MTCTKSLEEALLARLAGNMKKKEAIFIKIPQTTTVDTKLTKLEDLKKSIRLYIEVK